MGAFEQITVALPTQMAAEQAQSVEADEYASKGEIVRDALCDWFRARAGEQAKLDRLRRLIDEGDDSGPSIPADEIHAELYAIIDACERERRSRLATRLRRAGIWPR